MKNISDNIGTDVLARAGKIKLLLMDCDGVMTDGKIYFNDRGEEMKAFNTKDGHGIVSLHQAGLRTGVITGRTFSGLDKRVKELGMHFLRQGCKDKAKEFRNILADAGVTADEAAYIGDDIPDLAILTLAGLSVAVADATAELFEHCHYITNTPGGRGAVREVADLILKSRQNS